MFARNLVCGPTTLDTEPEDFVTTDDYMAAFEKCCKLKVIEASNEKVVFDLVGVDAAIANTLRRILIAEVPTMAIDKVFFMNNTSVMQDEVLAHRLGLIPIAADPDLFEFKSDSDESTDMNTLVFTLQVQCPQLKDLPPKGGAAANFMRLLSSQLEWSPQGRQKEFTAEQICKPAYPNILLLKLIPGQIVDVECHAVKGTGFTHAKWYSFPFSFHQGEEAREVKSLCPMNVFEIEDSSGVLVAKYPRSCTLCRECIREKHQDQIVLGRKMDHFIFSVESAGNVPAQELVPRALRVLKEKCENLLKSLSSDS